MAATGRPLGGHWAATATRSYVPIKIGVKRMFAFWERVLAADLSPMLPAGKISDNAHSHFTPRACGGELSSSGAARRDRPGRTYPAGLPAAVLANSLAEAHNILAVRPFRQVCTWAQGWILRLPYRIRARPSRPLALEPHRVRQRRLWTGPPSETQGCACPEASPAAFGAKAPGA